VRRIVGDGAGRGGRGSLGGGVLQSVAAFAGASHSMERPIAAICCDDRFYGTAPKCELLLGWRVERIAACVRMGMRRYSGERD